MLLTPTLRRERQANLCEFKVNLVDRVSFKTVRDTEWDAVSKTKTKQQL